MANKPASFNIAATIAARAAEVPDADFTNGMNNANCVHGVGIATENPNLEESLPNWTLLDQDEDARTPQDSQYIGGNGLGDGVSGKGVDPISLVTNDASGDGTVVDDGDATLADLAVGWAVV